MQIALVGAEFEENLATRRQAMRTAAFELQTPGRLTMIVRINQAGHVAECSYRTMRKRGQIPVAAGISFQQPGAAGQLYQVAFSKDEVRQAAAKLAEERRKRSRDTHVFDFIPVPMFPKRP